MKDVDSRCRLLYPLPMVTSRIRLPRGLLLLALLAVLILPVGLLSTACDCREAHEAFLCFTPATASLVAGDSLGVTATLQPEDDPADRACIEKSGWQWAWGSNDGGEIEFSDVEVQWGGASEGIYIAHVQCTAKKAGTVWLRIEQPPCPYELDFMGTFSCVNSCTITITTTPMMW